MRHRLVLDVTKWSIGDEGGAIVLTRVKPDEPCFVELTPGLLSLRLTHAQVH